MGAGAREPTGSRLRYLAGVVVRVCGVRATLSGWCGGAGLRGSAHVIWFVWLKSWLVGAGAREPAGSRLRYPAGGCAGLRVDGCAGLRSLAGSCGCAGARGSGNVIRLVWLCGFAGFGQRYLVRVVNKLAGGCGCAGTCWF